MKRNGRPQMLQLGVMGAGLFFLIMTLQVISQNDITPTPPAPPFLTNDNSSVQATATAFAELIQSDGFIATEQEAQSVLATLIAQGTPANVVTLPFPMPPGMAASQQAIAGTLPPIDPILGNPTALIEQATQQAIGATLPPMDPLFLSATAIAQGTPQPSFAPNTQGINPIILSATALVEQATQRSEAGTPTPTATRAATYPPATLTEIYAQATDRRATFDVAQLSATPDPILQQATDIIATATQDEINRRATGVMTPMPTEAFALGLPFSREQYLQVTAFAEAAATEPALLLSATIPGCRLPMPDGSRNQLPLLELNTPLTVALHEDFLDVGLQANVRVYNTFITEDCVTYELSRRDLTIAIDPNASEPVDVTRFINTVMLILSRYPAEETPIDLVYMDLFINQQNPDRYFVFRYNAPYVDLLNGYARGLRGLELLAETASN